MLFDPVLPDFGGEARKLDALDVHVQVPLRASAHQFEDRRHRHDAAALELLALPRADIELGEFGEREVFDALLLQFGRGILYDAREVAVMERHDHAILRHAQIGLGIDPQPPGELEGLDGIFLGEIADAAVALDDDFFQRDVVGDVPVAARGRGQEQEGREL